LGNGNIPVPFSQRRNCEPKEFSSWSFGARKEFSRKGVSEWEITFHHSENVSFHCKCIARWEGFTANVLPDGRDFVGGIYGAVVTTPPNCVATPLDTACYLWR
jgi:hypothetical protein